MIGPLVIISVDEARSTSRPAGEDGAILRCEGFALKPDRKK